MRRWFRMNMNYTMIAAMNINGFIGSTIKLIMRDEISDEGAAGTVNGEGFQEWVREYLLPVLGSYANNEDNSIVIMDNASTHMSRKVVRMIEGTGAYLLYSAPYSPDEYWMPCPSAILALLAFTKKPGGPPRRPHRCCGYRAL